MKNGWSYLTFLPLLLNTFFFSLVHSACTFPSALRGNWISSDKGTLNVTSDTIWKYPLPVTVAVTEVDLVCNTQSGETYMLRSKNVVQLFSVNFYIYVCFELHPISLYKFWYQVANEIESSTLLRMKPFPETITPNITSACNRVKPFADSTFNTFVKEGALENGLIEATCPFDLFHTFSNGTLTSADGATSCINTTLDICTDRTQMKITYDSSCNSTLKISSGGVNVCLLDRTSNSTGVTYLHVWNNDTTLAAGVKRINCYAFEKSGDTMIATLYPGACRETQNATYVTSPGIKVEYNTITRTCQNTAVSAPQTKYYVAIILGGTGFIFIVFLIVCVTYKTRCLCIRKLCNKNRIGHSDVSLTASMEDGMEPYLRVVKHPDIPRGVFIPRKPIKLGPIIEPYLAPPPKVELLYEVEPRPTSSRLMFSRSVFLSELSLRYKEAESNNDSNGVKIEEIDY